MIFNMTGGASLNFKVVPGLTQPGTAAENTLWVKTEKIGAWYFAPTQPSGMQPTDVWFLTGTNSNIKFNALKKNEIAVLPIETKQMTDNGLVSVEVTVYQNGAWTKLDTKKYVFKSGTGFDATVYKKLLSSNSISMNDFTTRSYSLLSGNAAIVLQTYANGVNDFCPLAFDIDLSKYKTMYIDATVEKSNGSSAEMALKAAKEGDNNITSIAETRFVAKSSGVRETFTYPVESITTVKRVCIYAWNGRKATIHNIWFE